MYISLSLFCLVYYILLSLQDIHHPFVFIDKLTTFNNFWLIISVVVYLLYLVRLKYKNKLISSFVMFCICTVILLMFMIKPKQVKDEEFCCQVDYIIVLGGGVYRDGVLSVLSKSRADRCVEIFYKLDNSPKIITSGGGGDRIGTSEGDQIKKYLIENGINDSLIYAETNATSTIENIDFAFDFINKECENDKISIMIITSDFHIKRAIYIALKKNYGNIIGIYSNTPILYKLNFYLREIFAWLKLIFKLNKYIMF